MTMYQEREASDPKGRRFRGAMKAAQKRLARAAALKSEDPKRAASLLSEALTHYLGDKLDAPASGLTLRRVLELLAAKAPGLGSPEHDEVRDMWEELDLLRFAPADADASAEGARGARPPASTAPSAPHGKGADPAEKLTSLLRNLEKEVRR